MNVDIQGRSDLPFTPGDSNPGSIIETPGGVGRNVAENLLRLGLETSLLTVLGDDSRASWLEAEAGRIGLDLSLSLRCVDCLSPTYLCLLDERGRLFGAVVDMRALEKLDAEFLASRFDSLDKADLLIIDANLSYQNMELLALRYGKGGVLENKGRQRPLLVFDPVSSAKAARGRPFLGHFDLLKPNRAEAAILAGLAPDPVPDLETLLSALRATPAAAGGGICVSLGAEGLYAEGGPQGGGGAPIRAIFRPPALPVVNVSGAGDAALAALAFGLLRGADWEERARLAVAAAALTASAEETVYPALGESILRDLARGVKHDILS